MSISQTKYFRTGVILLSVLFLVIYILTLDTGLQPEELHGGDLITHQYAQVQARPSNAPGYPLYTMGGWLWFHGGRALLQALGNPLPNPLPILSSYSLVWALAALVLFFAVFVELIGPTRHPARTTAAAFLVTVFYGLTYFFWYYATTTEQYSSAVAQTLAIVYVYLKWDAHPTRDRLILWLALLCGLSLAHMLTVAFIVPPLVAVMLRRAPKTLLRPRMVAGAVLAAAVPLVAYIYVYWRGALHPEWWGRGEWSSAREWFWAFLSTPQGREELMWSFEPGRTFFGNGFPELIWGELSLPLLLLGLVGLAWLPSRPRALFVGTLAIYLLFCWAYRFGNWFQVVLPAYPLILGGLAPLIAQLDRRSVPAPGQTPTLVQRATLPAAMLFLVGMVIWRGAVSLPRADSRSRPEDTALARAGELLAQPLPAHAPIFAAVDDALALDYLTRIWGIRADATGVDSPAANRLLAAGQPVYVPWDAAPTLLAELDVPVRIDGATAEWVELSPLPAAESAPAAVVAALATTPPTELVSVEAVPTPSSPTDHGPTAGLDVRLTWHLPAGEWPAGLSLSVRPLAGGAPVADAAGSPIQQDRPAPVYGLWQPVPTLPQTLVHDGYRLAVPAATMAQVDGLLIIAYVQNADGTFTNLLEYRHPLARTAVDQ